MKTESKYDKGDFLYEGKAKRIFAVKGTDKLLWLEFKDSMTAFNGVKKEEVQQKGQINTAIATSIFNFLSRHGVAHHWVQTVSANEMVCEKLKMIPLEVVVRNILAGSTAKKFNIEEGRALNQPLVEFFYKDDSLNDPFISDEQALMLQVVPDQRDLSELKVLALNVNQCLKNFFSDMGLTLVDFKLEFGWNELGKKVLGDEITPDSCRIWDSKTNEKLDKDRFRRDLGQVTESYNEILNRIKKVWGEML